MCYVASVCPQWPHFCSLIYAVNEEAEDNFPDADTFNILLHLKPSQSLKVLSVA